MPGHLAVPTQPLALGAFLALSVRRIVNFDKKTFAFKKKKKLLFFSILCFLILSFLLIGKGLLSCVLAKCRIYSSFLCDITLSL